MKLKTTSQGTVTVIAPEGNLMGGPDASELNARLHALVDEKKTSVVIDLTDVKFINSSGLGLLIGGLTTMREAGGDIKLACASSKILDLLKVTRLSGLIDHHVTVREAVASFKK